MGRAGASWFGVAAHLGRGEVESMRVRALSNSLGHARRAEPVFEPRPESPAAGSVSRAVCNLVWEDRPTNPAGENRLVSRYHEALTEGSLSVSVRTPFLPPPPPPHVQIWSQRDSFPWEVGGGG